MSPGNHHDSVDWHGLSELLSRLGDKWSVHVIARLAAGPMRFNRLRRSVDGISQRMLTLTLRALERDGLVQRTVYPTVPPQVEYRLTELGQTLIEPLAALSRWAAENLPQIEQAHDDFDRDARRRIG